MYGGIKVRLGSYYFYLKIMWANYKFVPSLGNLISPFILNITMFGGQQQQQHLMEVQFIPQGDAYLELCTHNHTVNNMQRY